MWRKNIFFVNVLRVDNDNVCIYSFNSKNDNPILPVQLQYTQKQNELCSYQCIDNYNYKKTVWFELEFLKSVNIKKGYGFYLRKKKQ